MEEDSHVVLVVGGIEASDIDGTACAAAIAKVGGVQRGSAIVCQVYRLPSRVYIGDPPRTVSIFGREDSRQARQQGDEGEILLMRYLRSN